MTQDIVRLLQQNIRKYRLQAGFTQEKLSEACGISCDYLSEIERGKRTPSLKRFLLIAKKLNTPPENFFQR